MDQQERIYQREYKRRKRLDPEFREHERAYNRAYWPRRRSPHGTPEQLKARSVISNAVRTGKILKPRVCDWCGGSEGRIEAHHWLGYDKPLDVIWLCRPCHEGFHHDGA